jgi:hypothetical protein
MVVSTRSFIFTSAKSSSKSVARLSKKHTKMKKELVIIMKEISTNYFHDDVLVDVLVISYHPHSLHAILVSEFLIDFF